MSYIINKHCSYIVLIIGLVPILFNPIQSNAQNQPSLLSGRVITSNGEPISNIDIGIGVIRSTTDTNGGFTLKNVPSKRAEFYSYDKINVRAIKFGNIAFYYHGWDRLDSLNYTIKPASNIDDIEVISIPELRIKGQIVYMDGTPLAKTSIDIFFETVSIESIRGSRYKEPVQTNSQGEFEYIVNSSRVSILSVNHRGLTAVTQPILFDIMKQNDTVVLTLDGNSDDLNEDVNEELKDNTSQYFYPFPDIPGVWIVNPENGQAYKWVKCKDRNDAKIIAAKENAHLVTITSEEEQIWLETVFTGRAYWIGLTYLFKEGKWEWDTGEPITYTNWGEPEKDLLRLTEHPLSILDNSDAVIKGYAILSGDTTWGNVSGKWIKVDITGGDRVGQVSMAILEKELE
ncbi:hypothetical protein JT359_19150 [Candidatus Poribacteria bacterium]|nr:hypothetical protein [Candidatus Poribacteria bacterium]